MTDGPDLVGRVAVVTGGANGIGRVTAQRLVAVDLFGVMVCCRAAAQHMTAHSGGSIVNIASGAGITPGVGMLPYRAAKAGVAHVTRCLAVELGEHGIRANCVAPAHIATDINAAFDKATVTRLQPVLSVDGGMSVGTPPRH